MDAEQIFHYLLKMAEGAAFPCDAAVGEVFFHLRIPDPQREGVSGLSHINLLHLSEMNRSASVCGSE